MRQWSHKVSPAWLLARRSVVTATELRDLRTTYKRATVAEKKGVKINEVTAGLWAEKHSLEVDPYSSGAAARGHHLEPYAVQEFNESYPEMHHWDDCIITDGFLGFSPDAMDVEQDESYGVKVHYSELVGQPTSILEIKSYSAKNHIKSCITPKAKLPERFQLAGAMAVCPSIEEAYLIFYNPSHEVGKFVVHYTREELQEEIKEVRELAAWVRLQFQACDNKLVPCRTSFTEDAIYKDYLEAEQLDSNFAIR